MISGNINLTEEQLRELFETSIVGHWPVAELPSEFNPYAGKETVLLVDDQYIDLVIWTSDSRYHKEGDIFAYELQESEVPEYLRDKIARYNKAKEYHSYVRHSLC